MFDGIDEAYSKMVLKIGSQSYELCGLFKSRSTVQSRSSFASPHNENARIRKDKSISRYHNEN